MLSMEMMRRSVYLQMELLGSKTTAIPLLGIQTSGLITRAMLSWLCSIRVKMVLTSLLRCFLSKHDAHPVQNNNIPNQGYYSIGINSDWLNGNQAVAAQLLIAPNGATTSNGGAHFGPIVTLQGHPFPSLSYV